MVWGGISVRSRTELLVLNRTLTGQRYINEVLQPVVLPFVQQHHVVLQDDTARPHRPRTVQQVEHDRHQIFNNFILSAMLLHQ